MAASKISICNSALARIGAPPISALEEDSKRARTCGVVYDQILDEVLAEHAWPFALTRASLARLADAPVYGYRHAYQLPADFVSLVDMEDGTALDYQLEGDQILTDAETVRLRYVRRITDPARFPPPFVDVFAIRLAAELALPITRKTSDFETMMTVYRLKLASAKNTISGSQGAAQEEVPFWSEARG